MATVKQIKELIQTNLYPDSLGKRNGNLLCRWGFFYRHGRTSDKYCDLVTMLLNANQIDHKVVDHGQIWKDFKGGASVARQSHFYVEIQLK